MVMMFVGEAVKLSRCMRIWILVEYWLRSFSPRMSSILLDVALGGDVVQDRAHIVFEICKNPKSTAHGHF